MDLPLKKPRCSEVAQDGRYLLKETARHVANIFESQFAPDKGLVSEGCLTHDPGASVESSPLGISQRKAELKRFGRGTPDIHCL